MAWAGTVGGGEGGGGYIKQEYVDASEDFWQRQRPPTAEEVKSISELPHPHVRDFRNLSVSPSHTRPQSFQSPVLRRRLKTRRKRRL